ARILQHVGVCTLQHPRRSTTKPCRMLSQCLTSSASFHSNQANLLILNKFVENSDRVRPATHASNDCGWQFALSLQNLRPRFPSNDAMKIPHHGRIRM